MRNEYYFEEAKTNTILQQYFKIKEELNEVFEEIAADDKEKIVLETLDMIQAAHNLLNKLEDGGIDLEHLAHKWHKKMKHYKEVKYGSEK